MPACKYHLREDDCVWEAEAEGKKSASSCLANHSMPIWCFAILAHHPCGAQERRKEGEREREGEKITIRERNEVSVEEQATYPITLGSNKINPRPPASYLPSLLSIPLTFPLTQITANLTRRKGYRRLAAWPYFHSMHTFLKDQRLDQVII